MNTPTEARDPSLTLPSGAPNLPLPVGDGRSGEQNTV